MADRLRHFAIHQPHFIVLIELSRDRQIAIQQGKSSEHHDWYPAGLSSSRGDRTPLELFIVGVGAGKRASGG
jgi:hypothetical protein